MRFRFTGNYTNGHLSVNAWGVTFIGREPSEVISPQAVDRLSRHAEFEMVPDEPEVATPVKRGRKPKAAK